MKRLYLLCLLLGFLPGWMRQSAITVTTNQARLDFPRAITFSLNAASNAPINNVVLYYRAVGQSCQESFSTMVLDFEPAQTVALDWNWEFKHSGNLPPGAPIEWQWQIQDSAGASLLTPLQTLTVEDDQFTWKNVSRQGVSVYWVTGNRDFGNELLDLAVAALERLANDVGIRPSGDVRLNVYPDFDALRATLFYTPEWTGGIAYPEYRIVSTAIAPGEYTWAADVIPHELGHLVTSELIFNCYGVRIPTWLDEGLAVYAEGATSAADIQRVKRALQNDSLEPLHNLTTAFPADDNQATLAYAQSGQVVAFMLQTYGSDKMLALLHSVQSGLTFDKALRQVYDLDMDGLDSAWRVSLGFAPLPTAQPTQPSATQARTPIPTLALWTAVAQVTSTPRPSVAVPSATITAIPSATSQPTATASPTAAPSPTPRPSRPVLPCAAALVLPVAAVISAGCRRSLKSRQHPAV